MDVGLVRQIDLEGILPLVILYIGPETILPLTSALAAVVGVVLMFWQRLAGLVRRIWRLLMRKELDV